MKRLENGSLAKNMMARRRRARFRRAVKCGPPQAGSILEYWPAAGGLDFGELSSVARRRRARFLQIVLKKWVL